MAKSQFQQDQNLHKADFLKEDKFGEIPEQKIKFLPLFYAGAL